MEPLEREALVDRLTRLSGARLRTFFAARDLGEAFDLHPRESKRQRIEQAFAAAKVENRLAQILSEASILVRETASSSDSHHVKEDFSLKLLRLAIEAEEEGEDLDLTKVAKNLELGQDAAARVLQRLQDDGHIELRLLRGDGRILGARILRVRSSGYRAVQEWSMAAEKLRLEPPPAPSPDEHWIPPRLWTYIQSTVEAARKSKAPTDWGKVTRDACVFLEDEIRKRSGDQSRCSRQDLAAKALKSNGGTLRMNKDSFVQDAWMRFVQGIFGAFSNPGVHTIRKHSASFAMGVVGAVSVVLDTFDSELGPLETTRDFESPKETD